MNATVLHPLSALEAAAIAGVLHNVEHIDVTVQVGATGVILSPARRALTTVEEVTVLRAFVGATDARVRWIPEVAR